MSIQEMGIFLKITNATEHTEVTTAQAAALLGLKPTTIRWAATQGHIVMRLEDTPRGQIRWTTLGEVARYRQNYLGKPGKRPTQASGRFDGKRMRYAKGKE